MLKELPSSSFFIYNYKFFCVFNNKYYCKRPSPTINNLHYYLLSTLPITITNEFRKKDAPCKIQGNIHVFEPVESNCYAFTMIGD